MGILGVSGSVAQSLLSALEAEAEVERIVGIDLHPPRSHPSRLEFHPADLRQAPLAKLLKGVEGVVHLAATPGEGRDHAAQVTRVARAVRDAGVRRLVVVTSIAAYGAHADNPVPIQEWHPFRPNGQVPFSKGWAEVEQALEAIEGELRPLELVRLRTALVVGPSLDERRGRLLTLNRVVLSSGYDPKIQLAHETDVAQACLQAFRPEASGVYHVAGDGPQSISELYRAAGATVLYLPDFLVRLMSVAAWRLRPALVPPEFLELAAHPVTISTSRIRRELGWEAELSTRDAFLTARQALASR